MVEQQVALSPRDSMQYREICFEFLRVLKNYLGLPPEFVYREGLRARILNDGAHAEPRVFAVDVPNGFEFTPDNIKAQARLLEHTIRDGMGNLWWVAIDVQAPLGNLAYRVHDTVTGLTLESCVGLLGVRFQTTLAILRQE